MNAKDIVVGSFYAGSRWGRPSRAGGDLYKFEILENLGSANGQTRYKVKSHGRMSGWEFHKADRDVPPIVIVKSGYLLEPWQDYEKYCDGEFAEIKAERQKGEQAYNRMRTAVSKVFTLSGLDDPTKKKDFRLLYWNEEEYTLNVEEIEAIIAKLESLQDEVRQMGALDSLDIF